jgi:preprotein translocase subunit SecF
MFIVKYKSLFIGIAVAMVVGSILLVSHFGIKKGIDFTGGTVVEISYATSTAPSSIDQGPFEEKGIKVFATGATSYKFISKKSYEETVATISTLLNKTSHPYVETQVNTVGPSMGREMTQKAMIAIIVVAIAILSFIAFAFREVSVPVASWKYGVVAMVTIIHDIIIPTGVYAYLSAKYGAEIDTLFIVALLTVMAVTISDKIVVFDRIRENLKTYGHKRPFDDVVGESLLQTFTRSINTSVTVIISLLALYFIGPESTKFFALTLTVGMIVGTYSSIFVASPALTYFVEEEKGGKKKK